MAQKLLCVILFPFLPGLWKGAWKAATHITKGEEVEVWTDMYCHPNLDPDELAILDAEAAAEGVEIDLSRFTAPATAKVVEILKDGKPLLLPK